MLNPCSASYKLLSITVNQLTLCVHKSRNVSEETMIFIVIQTRFKVLFLFGKNLLVMLKIFISSTFSLAHFSPLGELLVPVPMVVANKAGRGPPYHPRDTEIVDLDRNYDGRGLETSEKHLQTDQTCSFT